VFERAKAVHASARAAALIGQFVSTFLKIMQECSLPQQLTLTQFKRFVPDFDDLNGRCCLKDKRPLT
jgi:hypothetical protein